jgi:protein TonB
MAANYSSTAEWRRLLLVLKYPVTFIFGAISTVMLFYLMQYLIDSGESALTESPNLRIVDFIRLKEEPEVQTKKRRPKPPPAPDEPPPEIQQTTADIAIDDSWSARFNAPLAEINMNSNTSFQSDGEYLPILKVQPVYPRNALQRGLFGWVIVEFTVDELGRVVDPIVVESCVESFSPKRLTCENRPGRTFDRAALQAAAKFKYKPKVIDGVPIETAGVRNLITFELNEMKEFK